MKTSDLYLINETYETCRSISVLETEEDWGLKLALSGDKPLERTFGPIPVEWTPETRARHACDFAYFRPNLKCLSESAFSTLEQILTPHGVWIKLNGLEGKYVAFQCQIIVDALDQERSSQLLNIEAMGDFHNPRFAPVLRREVVLGSHVFRLPESMSKMFVDEEFRSVYADARLTGLEFIPVVLA